MCDLGHHGPGFNKSSRPPALFDDYLRHMGWCHLYLEHFIRRASLVANRATMLGNCADYVAVRRRTVSPKADGSICFRCHSVVREYGWESTRTPRHVLATLFCHGVRSE